MNVSPAYTSRFGNVPDPKEDKPKRLLTGHSALYYADLTIDPQDTLLGQRWLCRKGGALIVASSGQGKSVLTAQGANSFACGRTAFGIKPSGPLRSLIVQAEDDDGDMKEMCQTVYHMGLNKYEQEDVRKNTHIEPLNDLSGVEFLQAIDGFLEQWPADLLWINPLTAYLGADDKDTKASTLFLRNGLNPILTKHDCGAVIIHHTPKTNFANTDNYKPSDWMYRGAGAATITNWARAIMVIDPCDAPGVYKFIAAKRGKRIGWGDPFPAFETYWAHSQDDKLLWIPASDDQIKATAKTKRNLKADDLLEFIPAVDGVIAEKIISAAASKMGEKKVRSFLKELAADEKISVEEVKRKGKRPEVKYVKNSDSGNCQ
jgi:hypothetical protein